ncbi:MAG: hypothetical protein ACKVIE_04185 [Candidatus Poseidoniales archaeon]|jgi:hypothetical protein|nr:hypothetical protein [Candidatus Thalassarchaeaceae archaeon]|tara:strand:- start:2662 stop:2940 length:279 start_codon:yes stop_codon:yes gene_type:complete
MSINTTDSVEGFLQGEKEPSGSWIFIALGVSISLSFLLLYSILYPGQDLPVISDLVPVFSGVFDSGIWFFILGTMIGVFAILGRLLLEATSE